MVAGRPRFEVADVVRAHGDEYRRAHPLSPTQNRVLNNIAVCRTAVLGGHLDQCTSCGHTRISYNSCRDRHCPKCQGPQRAEWIEQRLERLLPVPYFHVVFTLPDDLNPLALRNKKVVYAILFKAASQTLLQIARDPGHLGATISVTAVLHTWAQNLLLHPHLHCVVTGGGLAPDGTHWISGRRRYFLPVKVLGKLFRGKFLHALEQAYRKGRLDCAGSTSRLLDPAAWAAFRDRLYLKNWVVYAKPPFGGPEQVFRYLGRYTHRVAISNHRIVDFRESQVTFTVRDRTDGSRRKHLSLNSLEFLRRFLLHVLPKGFVRIRHYGLSAGRNVNTLLVTARELLTQNDSDIRDEDNPEGPALPVDEPWWERFRARTGIDVMACPYCGGRFVRREALPYDITVQVDPYPARASPVAS